MDDRRVADYFVVAGLPDNPLPLEEFSNEAAIKTTYKQDPITDITIINKSLSEKVPRGYQCLEKTAQGYSADLNHGSIRTHEMYICYRRSRDKPPLTDVGVLYEGKERLMTGCEVIHTTYFGTPANVNNSNNGRTYITFRRAAENAPSDMLAVADLCIILENKGESPPHSYNQILKNLNRGLMGSDVFLCYKKAMTKTDILAYKPAILDRYPKEDYEDFPLPDSVSMFCLPMGATVECWSAKAQHPYPIFSTFILTGMQYKKVYGAAVTFYEEYPESRLTDLQMRHLGMKNKHIREQYRIMKTVHVNKSICLLSHWPFFDAFKKLLGYMYRISITGPHVVPIERHISHFMYDVPYPSPQRPRILVQLSQDSLSLSMPEDSPLPQSGASYITLLRNLGPENCMTILLYVLHEHKILIHSLRPAVLTSVAEAVANLIFPLQWQCPYIPLCPLGLSDVLSAPTPYIIGLDSRYFDLFDPPPDVICIDLDTIRIWPPEDKKTISYKMLPKKPTKVLQESLHHLYDRMSQELPRGGHDDVTLDMAPLDQDFKRKHREMLMELQIQETFLRFMACILKGYKHYLKPIANAPDLDTTNAASLFDMAGFLKSREKANHKFFQTLLRTQLFNRFIEERSFVSDKDDSLAFFDECTEKVTETTDEPKLIELDDSSKSERTMFILPPEPTGLPDGKTYSYNGFPSLQPELFLEKNKPTRSSSQNKGQTGGQSPVVRRTKQEIKTAQKLAAQYHTQPLSWAKCLLSHCYSLWFMVLPAYIKQGSSVNKSLMLAYDVMKNMQRQKLRPPDELCYRVMLQLCGQYNQPVLAVKVYSEMKHAGVHPNAITYGYYNKAVLEGRWPTSISHGRLLWRKLRNVVLGVAKFKKAVRRRSLSVCSNSGSEYDQISHASFDSCLEEEGQLRKEGKHESIMKTEAGGHMEVGPFETGTGAIKHGKIPEEVERAPSDRGYNSMTQEDAKKFSEIISEENHQSESKLKREIKNVLSFSFRRNKHSEKKESEIREEGAGDEEAAFLAAELSSSEPRKSGEHFRARIGSIVRQCSVGSSAGTSPRFSSLFGSSAGLLMVSDSLVSGTLSKSMGPTVGEATDPTTNQEKNRKRHKSAGDHYQIKPRSNSLFAGWKTWMQHGEDKSRELAELGARDEAQQLLKEENSTTALGQEMDGMSEEIKDSGVGLDENEEDTSADRTSNGKENSPLDMQEACGEIEDDKNRARFSDQDEQEEKRRSFAEIKSRSNSLKSVTSSPLHVVATPVTENDPLGLFTEPEKVRRSDTSAADSATTRASPEKVRQDFVAKTPFQDELNSAPKGLTKLDLGKCNNLSSPSGASSNRVEKTCEVCSGKVLSPVDKVQKQLFKIERTNSFPDNLGVVTPNKSNNAKSDVASLGRSSSSLYETRTTETPRSGLFRTGSFRRHKDNISGMLKFATGAVASKLTELKVSMTPSKLGSNSSLTPSYDDVDSDSDSYREPPRSKGSIDFLHRSIDRLDTNSLTGLQESAPNAPSFLEQMSRECEAERMAELQRSAITGNGGSSHHVQWSIGEGDSQAVALEVEMSSCCRCTRCRCLLYDEEIMAGWNADHSNLNTSCPFCSNKLVPHLLVYIKDHRKRKNSQSSTGDTSTTSDSLDSSPVHQVPSSGQSYGKDVAICPQETSADADHFMFGDDMDDHNSVPDQDMASHDPWMRQSAHEDFQSKPSDIPSPTKTPKKPSSTGPSLSDMARASHRRTASECLTSATEFAYSSSLDSCESLTFRNLRSPLSFSGDDSDVGRSPERKRAMLDGGLSSMEPVSVPYLSPLVLRKNLESIIETEGNGSLARQTFLDDHPIIFWNLMWYFKRIGTFSHLPAFLLTNNTLLRVPEGQAESVGVENVRVRAKWDNVRIHQEIGLPMYLAWDNQDSSTTVDALLTESQPFNRAVMHQIITNIQCNDVLSPMKMVMNGRRRMRIRGKRFRSMYREILYLAFVACGRENIDNDAFDREYKEAFAKLSPGEIKRLQRDDRPRSTMIDCCRRVFYEMDM